MRRPDETIRPFIPVTPSAITPRDPNWLAIAATIFFALGFAVAVQL